MDDLYPKISYRMFNKRVGIQFSLYPHLSDYRNSVSIGTSFMYRMIDGGKFKLYLNQSNQYIYSDEYVTIWNYPNGYFNIGAGLGFEFVIKKYFSFNIIVSYDYMTNFYEANPGIELGYFYKL